MKNFKKLMAMLVAGIMVLALVGCSGSTNDAEMAEKTVKDYCDAFKNTDFEKAMTFVAEDSALYESLDEDKNFLSEDNLATLPGEIPTGAEKAAENFAKDIKESLERIYKAIKIEVESVSVDGDSATVTVKTNYDLGKIVAFDEQFSKTYTELYMKKIVSLTEKENIEENTKYLISSEAYRENCSVWGEKELEEMNENSETSILQLKKESDAWKIDVIN